MRKKKVPVSDPVVSKEILETAKLSLDSDKLRKPLAKCVVCGAESSATPVGDEPLCWVCRRLKISAWHESEQQMPAQE